MEISESTLGSYAPDFELPGTDGQVHHLSRYLETHRAVAVVFMGNNCPYVRSYLDRLKQLQTEFAPQGFTLIGINANDMEKSPDDRFDNMKQFAIAHDLHFPYVRDHTQDVAESFGATVTPEVFLIDQDAIICYRGRIDDQTELDTTSVKTSYFRNGILGLLQNKPITITFTQSIGSKIQWR